MYILHMHFPTCIFPLLQSVLLYVCAYVHILYKNGWYGAYVTVYVSEDGIGYLME